MSKGVGTLFLAVIFELSTAQKSQKEKKSIQKSNFQNIQ
jgi:hypothetical protein|tara:strand:- start:263 stop:379 length:117 start_codon:yes stop_codon:yes gene_type:complete